MLFSEQVRIIKDEETLVEDTSTYASGSAVHDWQDRVSKQITLTSSKMVCLKFDAELWVVGTYWSAGAGRVLLNTIPLISTGGISHYGATAGSGTTVTRMVYLILDAGTYTFTFQSSIWYIQTGASPSIRIKNIYISIFNFPDKQAFNYDSSSILIPATSTSTLINQSFTTPQTRKLAVGSIKKYVAHIFVYAERIDQRVSKMKNPSDADEANFFNWRILLNDNQQSWTDKNDDYEAKGTTTNSSYGEGAYGRLSLVLDPNTQYNLKITCYNGFTLAYNGRVIVRLFICPWILSDNLYEPVALEFPQGSTLYVILEPLVLDPTKSIRIGKKRAISFGDSADYYSSASGTGILSHYYTFEIIDVDNSLLLCSGFGACISVLAVDVR